MKICLFHKDLRLDDNPALSAATIHTESLLPVYIYDAETRPRQLGEAQKWWLHHSLLSLQQALAEKGSSLIIRQGQIYQVLHDLCEKYDIKGIYYNSPYTEYEMSQFSLVKAYCASRNIEIQAYCGQLLFDPWQMCKADGSAYKVYTAYKNAFLTKANMILAPQKAPEVLPPCPDITSLHVEDLALISKKPQWSIKLENYWLPGETYALRRLDKFMDSFIEDYHLNRDYPAIEGTSGLSPYLQMGEISPRRVWHEISKRKALLGGISKGCDVFFSELIWREFAYHILYYNPALHQENYRKEFDRFEWQKDEKFYQAWCKGQTGYPIIDAGMRQLWETGWMHNRVRMIVASFLIKDLLIDWREGEKWFWNTLVDADPALNPFNWQWVAGSGVDASPYFRIFNPTTQQVKFDADQKYIKRWVRELDYNAIMQNQMRDGGLKSNLDTHSNQYPKPIVNHDKQRVISLESYKRILR